MQLSSKMKKTHKKIVSFYCTVRTMMMNSS